MDQAITVENLHKRYGEVQAVRGVSFSVNRGEILGLLGPNGAGKTTTLECLEGLRQPDQGQLAIMGVDPTHDGTRLRDVIGVQLQTSGLPPDMTVAEAMRFICAYHGLAPRTDLLARMGLAEHAAQTYAHLSTGQQRRLALTLAIAHRPPVVILDEPTAGLDVASRTELHQLMQELRDEGTAVLLATHDMAEAEKMTDRVAILLQGQIVASGTPKEITATGSAYTKVSVRSETDSLKARSAALPGVVRTAFDEDYVILWTTNIAATVTAVLAGLQAANDPLVDLRVERPTLEERFLEITHFEHNGGTA